MDLPILCNRGSLLLDLNTHASPPNPRQLIMKLLSSSPDNELDAAGAIRGGALFDISANNTRVALARLQANGLIETVARGAYTLGSAGQVLGRSVSAWRNAEEQLREWDGSWIAVLTASLGRRDRKALRARERAFALLGLRELETGLCIRPDNLAGGVCRTRERLMTLGLEDNAAVFRMDSLDAGREALACTLWQDESLETGYRHQQQVLLESMARLPGLSDEAAARESYLLGDSAIKRLVFDPLLPAPLVDTACRSDFRATVRRYEEMGQRAWHAILTDSN